MKIDLYPEKSQYLTNQEINLIAELFCDNEEIYEAEIEISYLNKLIKKLSCTLKNGVNIIPLEGFSTAFSGYGVDLSIIDSINKTFMAQTAFDVVDKVERSMRYGFLSDFKLEDGENHRDIESLRKFHINMVQFYDWSYRHDNLVAPTTHYKDMMGKEINLDTVKGKIQTAKDLGMNSMAYGAIYAASKEFYEKHPDWAFYTSCGDVFKFIDTFYIMNILKECPWHHHIIEQYHRAIDEVGFSGIHMDTYGFPKTAYSKYKGESKLVRLDEEFASLIDDTKAALSHCDKDTYLIFNNVGNWPVAPVSKANQSAIYIEVWNPYNRYLHIKQIISDAKAACDNKKPVILAAYLAPFRLEDSKRAGYAAYILTAAIVSNGGYHLLLGEENAVLTQGYYVDHSFLQPEQVTVMRNYYDFMIRYMNLFYNDRMKDVSMTHIGWDNYEYQCSFDNWSSYGEADKVWLNIRENEDFKCISMVNLCGCKDDLWNKGKDKPVPQEKLEFTVHVDKDIKGVYYASPDKGDTKSYPLEFTYLTNDKGKFIRFEVPYLEIWSLVYIEL